MTNQYTVMLRAPDYAEGSNQRDMTIITFVWALTPTHAAHIARGMAAIDNDVDFPDDYECIAVFEGQVLDRYEPVIDTPERQAELDAEIETLEKTA